MEQSREWRSTLPYTSVWLLLKKKSLRVTLANFTLLMYSKPHDRVVRWQRKILERISSDENLSCCTASMSLPDPLSPLVYIVHCFREVFKAISGNDTELLCRGSSWSSCLSSSMWRGPLQYIPYGFIPTFPVVSSMSGSSNLDSFCDGWLVAV